MGMTIIGLEEVVGAMEVSGQRLGLNLIKAVTVTSNKVKAGAQKRISGHRRLPMYPASITYDIKAKVDSVEGEIGPDKALPQGPLGNLLEFGTAKAPPMPHLGPALDENADDLLKGVEIAIRQAL